MAYFGMKEYILLGIKICMNNDGQHTGKKVIFFFYLKKSDLSGLPKNSRSLNPCSKLAQ